MIDDYPISVGAIRQRMHQPQASVSHIQLSEMIRTIKEGDS
jgi:hypothetical protein